MFEKERMFKTKYQYHKLMEQFFKEYHVEHTINYERNSQLVYMTKMNKRTFQAFCDYLLDLRKLDYYPIIL